MADVKLSKRDFDFNCYLLHKISIVDSTFRNGTTNILCSVLNSRLLKPTILKFSFIFIEFLCNFSVRVSITIYSYHYSKPLKAYTFEILKTLKNA